MTTNTALRSSLAVETFLFAGRLFTHWRREPLVPIQAVLFPTFLLITYYLLVGESVTKVTGTDSLYGLVPTCAVAGAMFGALAASFNIRVEREYGLLSRMWVLPVHRASALTGRLVAEAARTLVASAMITVVGVGLGLRFQGTWLDLAMFLVVPAAVAVIFSMALIAIAVRTSNSMVLMWLSVPAIGAVFASSGSPPVELLPGWIRPVIEFQPMAATIGAMRSLALGDPALPQILVGLLWAVGLAAVIGPLAVVGYRAAAESGP
ncbi:ABC transporter permease [Mycolicibacterium sp. BiH015]|uniref:ABC transporter permease n=1 Tax=Mycolicibacterium sp. BiH015 TaxID=3018808 RepID=UPI0022E8C2BB|nr:ABC transporter permease [Mycolicibacterium sp. BiH015]MDA2895416.1 ABC transporter permease [Mycolicibacterium sp. BiH015]